MLFLIEQNIESGSNEEKRERQVREQSLGVGEKELQKQAKQNLSSKDRSSRVLSGLVEGGER